MPENLLNIIAVSLYIFVIIGAIIYFILNRFAPVKSVKAEVVNKQINETLSRYSGTGKRKKYVIVFFSRGKEKILLCFPVLLWRLPDRRKRNAQI